jgi:DNA-binding transcriptional LysR family regulator
MELRHLRYFVAVAEERSFTRAAERLWIAQPGLSTQVRRLETEMGVQLLERHPRGVNLTQAGELFLSRARAALAAADVAAATARDLEAGAIGSVRLGVASGPSWPLTMDVLSRFSHERPRVELSVLQGYGGALWRELRDSHLDALLGPAGHAGPDLKSLDLGSSPWVVLTGNGHRLAGDGPIAAAELAGERVAVTGHRDGFAVDRAVGEVLAELGVAAELVPSGPWPVMHAAVAANEVVALTTTSTTPPSGVNVRELAPRRMLPFELVWRAEGAPPALAAFIDLAATQHQLPASRVLAAVA